jgi:5-methyltetrahydrofolate--homocysteine methyltransferase
MADLKQLHDAILTGDTKTAVAVTRQALAENVDPGSLINEVMIPAMNEVGKLYEEQEYFVPELLLAGRAMKGALELIRPLLAETGTQPTGRVVIGTVQGDLHDIGKNLVVSMLEGAGFEVTDLGVDVTPEKFIEAVRTKKPDIICLSALLTVTMPAMRTTIEAMSRAGVRNAVKILIGGAPVTREFAKQIGADGYGETASVAVTVARAICGASVA